MLIRGPDLIFNIEERPNHDLDLKLLTNEKKYQLPIPIEN